MVELFNIKDYLNILCVLIFVKLILQDHRLTRKRNGFTCSNSNLNLRIFTTRIRSFT